MKNYLILFLVLISQFGSSQENQIVSIHAVQIEGDLSAFEEVQAVFMKKVAQEAANRGDIAAWNFLRSFRLDGINDEEDYNYIFVQGSTSIEKVVDSKNAWWNLSSDVLTEAELQTVANLRSKFTWKKDVRVLYTINSGIWLVKDTKDYLNTFIQFNFATVKDPLAFVDDNVSVWKPFFEKNAEKLNMISWGVGTKILPTGEKWSNVMTWDMFSTLVDLLKYKQGVDIDWPMEETNLFEINPDGFTTQDVWEWLAGTSSNN